MGPIGEKKKNQKYPQVLTMFFDAVMLYNITKQWVNE